LQIEKTIQNIGDGKMNQEHMKVRTKEFAKKVILLCKQLPPAREGRLVGAQFFRAGTSAGANYRAACRARSKADFISSLVSYWKKQMSHCIGWRFLTNTESSIQNF